MASPWIEFALSSHGKGFRVKTSSLANIFPVTSLKNTKQKSPALPEFVALMAFMSSLMALSTDAMLPALPQIGLSLGVSIANDNQLIVISVFVGMALGLLLYGPLSDSYGRKPPLYAGLSLFIVGCVVSIFAKDLSQMLVGRVIQGMGLAAPRVVSMAMIRDKFQGEAMAKVMSFVMMIFILVPALAPALGQGILFFAPWQSIFILFVGLTVVILVWFGLRQPETLVQEKRVPFALKQVGRAVLEVCKLPASMGPTLSLGLIFGAIVGYLSTSQQIFQGLYKTGDQFVVHFGMLALVFGLSSFLNARLVQGYGMRKLSLLALVIFTAVSILFFFVVNAWGGVPPYWSFLLFMAVAYFCMAVLFGNLNAMAMAPLGHIAGVGAAVVGTISTLVSVALSIFIGQLYNETLLPLVGSFALLGGCSMLMLNLTARKPLKAK